MLQIKDTLVSLDIVEKYFCCDVAACHGDCCIEGEAGAPITPEEFETLNEVLPEIIDDLTPAARRRIEEAGVGYYDVEGDLVTQIVDGRECVFTTYAPGGLCQCALEVAHSQGRIPFRKPASCALYPIRRKEYDGFTALNYHRWKICRCAEVAGRAKGVRVYEFLAPVLIEQYGQEWYDELALTAREWLKQTEKR